VFSLDFFFFCNLCATAISFFPSMKQRPSPFDPCLSASYFSFFWPNLLPQCKNTDYFSHDFFSQLQRIDLCLPFNDPRPNSHLFEWSLSQKSLLSATCNFPPLPQNLSPPFCTPIPRRLFTPQTPLTNKATSEPLIPCYTPRVPFTKVSPFLVRVPCLFLHSRNPTISRFLVILYFLLLSLSRYNPPLRNYIILPPPPSHSHALIRFCPAPLPP